VRRFHEVKADALIAIGGDGGLRIASRFGKKGIPVIGVTKTSTTISAVPRRRSASTPP